MIGPKAALKPGEPGRQRLRGSRIATLATVLLIHLGFLVFLLAPPPAWRSPAQTMWNAAPDALLVRLLPPRASPSHRSVPRMPRPVHATATVHRAASAALPTHVTTQAAAPQPTPRAADSLIATSPPTFIRGGGRFAGSDYGRENLRLPGSSAPVRGMPVFRMADSRMQGLPGVVRSIGRITGAIGRHCLQHEHWQEMTARERVDQHVDADAAQMAAIAARYGCSDPLKPGAAMYYFYRQRKVVGAH